MSEPEYRQHPLILIYRVPGADHLDIEMYDKACTYQAAEFGQVIASLMVVIEDKCGLTKQEIYAAVNAAYARSETHAKRAQGHQQ